MADFPTGFDFGSQAHYRLEKHFEEKLRADVIEECAALCEKLAGENLCDPTGLARGDQGRACAEAIRALASTRSTHR